MSTGRLDVVNIQFLGTRNHVLMLLVWLLELLLGCWFFLLFVFLLYYNIEDGKGMLISIFFRNWPFSGEDDRGKTSPRALVFTRCDIQSERL
jgi:hypothetical protein